MPPSFLYLAFVRMLHLLRLVRRDNGERAIEMVVLWDIELAHGRVPRLHGIVSVSTYIPAWSGTISRRKALVGTLSGHEDGVNGVPRLAKPRGRRGKGATRCRRRPKVPGRLLGECKSAHPKAPRREADAG